MHSHITSTLLAGVNHAASGLAQYVNIALSDPLARRGLHAFDDSELRGSARELLAGSAQQGQADKMFAVRFARNCTGGCCVGR